MFYGWCSNYVHFFYLEREWDCLKEKKKLVNWERISSYWLMIWTHHGSEIELGTGSIPQAKIRCVTVGHKRQNPFKHRKPTESFKIINEEAKLKPNENQLNVISLKLVVMGFGEGGWRNGEPLHGQSHALCGNAQLDFRKQWYKSSPTSMLTPALLA